ncbi:phosphoribosylaminoimidazolesuccinocarboxamide synthase, partial [archaeon]|nr:phosphoribosylaminoimidazolesuccinocarboxamide synthase [archaeon]
KGELKAGMRNYLIPLELIFRNSLPDGSSVFKRLEKKETTLEQLGLKKMPVVGEKLAKPILDVSTKLEPTDRYLDWAEAQELSCLNGGKMADLKEKILRVNDFLNRKAESIGLEHADGKVEFALGPEGNLMLVAVCGTLDEDRLLFKDFHISKQVLRDYYKTTPWFEWLSKAKEEFPDDKSKWPKPPKLPTELIDLVSSMYKGVCEAWTGRKIWNAPSIEAVITQYKAFLGKA